MPAISTTASEEQHHSLTETGVWIFILADMCIFCLYFWVFTWDKSHSPEQFITGQSTLNTYYGALNTFVLLVSSYFVASAVNAARQQKIDRFKRFLKLTIFCGVIFLVVKCLEYTEKFNAGFHIVTNEFYRNYFAFTGFHMLHVIIGLSLLSYILFESKKSEYLNDHQQFIEGSALYWHMVDLLWVILFSLIYLVP
jgi:nitric oxide reductase NorE protein